MSWLHLLCAAAGVALAASGAAFAEETVRLEEAAADRLPELVRGAGGTAVLVNVWATWCAPCVEEFPELLRAARAWEARGVKLLLISADFKKNIPQAQTFLAKHGVKGVSYVKGGDDDAFVRALSPDWSGAIPATFAFDANGRLRDFHEGKADYNRFNEMIVNAMKGGN